MIQSETMPPGWKLSDNHCWKRRYNSAVTACFGLSFNWSHALISCLDRTVYFISIETSINTAEAAKQVDDWVSSQDWIVVDDIQPAYKPTDTDKILADLTWLGAQEAYHKAKLKEIDEAQKYRLFDLIYIDGIPAHEVDRVCRDKTKQLSKLVSATDAVNAAAKYVDKTLAEYNKVLGES